ncbi:hypothetical protein EJB05_29723 [Eragrostis curvula]|uniref:Uncharacterized protein n=1 Tax=Eragrostis curvula TaxID=38414 RepID=A0A5J9UV06_9POAL|nr:hypothetical protein EJB05_29723 [Eragrostis curvula]
MESRFQKDAHEVLNLCFRRGPRNLLAWNMSKEEAEHEHMHIFLMISSSCYVVVYEDASVGSCILGKW